MAATVLIHDDAFELLDDDTPIGERQTLDAAALTHLQGLAARYALLEQRPDPAETHAIGRDLYRWIDSDQRLVSRLIESALPPLLLTVHCPAPSPSPVEWALLHLSCHGHHAWRDNPKQDPRPVLILEDGAFGQRPTDAVELLRALRPAMPRLLFLSACLTAAAPGHEADRRSALPPAGDSKQPDGGLDPAAPDAPAHSLTSALIQAGLPAILGWDGSVADTASSAGWRS